jgi:hypothetical protein
VEFLKQTKILNKIKKFLSCLVFLIETRYTRYSIKKKKELTTLISCTKGKVFMNQGSSICPSKNKYGNLRGNLTCQVLSLLLNGHEFESPQGH